MVRFTIFALGALLMSGALVARADDPKKDDKAKSVVPVAITTFQERGRDAKDMGPKVTDLLFAKLVVNPDFYLVERQELEKLLKEDQLSLSGLVDPSQAVKVGQLTGAKVLLTGSVIHVDKDLYLVAKLIGVESSRVLGASVKGDVEGAIDGLVEKLAEAVGTTVKDKASLLLVPPAKAEDRAAAINKALGDRKR